MQDPNQIGITIAIAMVMIFGAVMIGLILTWVVIIGAMVLTATNNKHNHESEAVKEIKF